MLGHLSATNMNIGKAPMLLKKAVTMCKSKTSVLAGRLLVLASLRRRMARVGAISHKIQTLIVAADQANVRLDYHKALLLRKIKTMRTINGGEIIDLRQQLALFDKEDNGDDSCPDWTLHPIFNDNDNCCYIEEYAEDDEEPSVVDVIRSIPEVEGLEFNLDYDIDQAAEMFIIRFREQMN
ncbi:uncharacterized protein LOC124651842 [Lolium rigidum]|uniref:uncharacterized protein LOC124651842 n=1 Tax=Lolium rigidum TaxID=89674 RepID=UPI001F5C38C4|nr:uncharacterized protein LOC124651842 [Lolium rigidum]